MACADCLIPHLELKGPDILRKHISVDFLMSLKSNKCMGLLRSFLSYATGGQSTGFFHNHRQKEYLQ